MRARGSWAIEMGCSGVVRELHRYVSCPHRTRTLRTLGERRPSPSSTENIGRDVTRKSWGDSEPPWPADRRAAERTRPRLRADGTIDADDESAWRSGPGLDAVAARPSP